MARTFLMNSKQTARSLGCSQRHVQRLAVRGLLRNVAILDRGLRFRPETVAALIEKLEGVPVDAAEMEGTR